MGCAELTGRARRLAAYLDQRRRLGEPGIVPQALDPGELIRLLASAARAPDRPGHAANARTGQAVGTIPGGGVDGGVAFASSEAPDAGAVTGDYHAVREEALACTRCRLSGGRTTVVFSDGNPAARLMVVGEAPGAREDATGLPFVGQAGRLLDLMLACVGLSRKDSVYICNVLKCRPPGNRNPLPDEIESCAPFLKRQIELVAPEVLLAVGSFGAQWLTESKKALGRLRGQVYSYQGVPLVVTYHPAAVLRNPGWSRLVWDDLQLLREVMDRKQ